MSTVGQHGSFDAGVVHLHHEGSRDARALLYPQRGLRGFILLSDAHINIYDHTPTDGHTSYPADGTVPDVVSSASTTKTSVVCGETGDGFHVVAENK